MAFGAGADGDFGQPPRGRGGPLHLGFLLDAAVLGASEAARLMNLAVSPASDPPRTAGVDRGVPAGQAARSSTTTILLFGIFDDWLAGLPAEAFPVLLPMLRRTFGTFEAPCVAAWANGPGSLPDPPGLGPRRRDARSRAGATSAAPGREVAWHE